MFKIVLVKPGYKFTLPLDVGLKFKEACYRADRYKAKSDEKTLFSVVNMRTEFIEYQV